MNKSDEKYQPGQVEYQKTYIGSVLMSGILDSEECFAWRPIKMVKVAFMAGSSRQGNASRAAVGSNCVTPNDLTAYR